MTAYKKLNSMLEDKNDLLLSGVDEDGNMVTLNYVHVYDEDDNLLPDRAICKRTYQKNGWVRINTYHINGVIEEEYKRNK